MLITCVYLHHFYSFWKHAFTPQIKKNKNKKTSHFHYWQLCHISKPTVSLVRRIVIFLENNSPFWSVRGIGIAVRLFLRLLIAPGFLLFLLHICIEVKTRFFPLVRFYSVRLTAWCCSYVQHNFRAYQAFKAYLLLLWTMDCPYNVYWCQELKSKCFTKGKVTLQEKFLCLPCQFCRNIFHRSLYFQELCNQQLYCFW